MQDEKQIKSVIEHVKQHLGINLTRCSYFDRMYTHQGYRYFNVILGRDLYNCQSFAQLQRLADESKLIKRVEQNGVDRVAIFVNGGAK